MGRESPDIVLSQKVRLLKIRESLPYSIVKKSLIELQKLGMSWEAWNMEFWEMNKGQERDININMILFSGNKYKLISGEFSGQYAESILRRISEPRGFDPDKIPRIFMRGEINTNLLIEFLELNTK